MSVLLTSAIYIDSVLTPVGTTVSLGYDREEEIVSAGEGTWVVKPTTPIPPPSYPGFASFTTSPSDGVAIVRPDGKPLLAVAKAFVGTGGANNSTGTTIQNSTNPVGTYTTKLKFGANVRDDLGSIIDLANSRLYVPAGYNECRVIYNLAWGIAYWSSSTTYAVGDSVVPTAYTAGSGFQYVVTSITTGISGGAEPTWPVVAGNTVVDGGVTWTCRASGWATGWRGCRIKNGAGNNFGNTRIGSVGDATTTNNGNTTPWVKIVASAASAPDTIAAGDYFEIYPAQTSGQPMTCGADAASSFVQLEVR